MTSKKVKFSLILFSVISISIISLDLTSLTIPVETIRTNDQDIENIVLHLDAKRFEFTPNKLNVNYGSNVTIFLHAIDVVHGFYLEGYDITQTMGPDYAFSISFIADKIGTFIFKCSEPSCGSYHPYMVGSLTVSPNNPFNVQMIVIFSSFIAINIFFYRNWRKQNAL